MAWRSGLKLCDPKSRSRTNRVLGTTRAGGELAAPDVPVVRFSLENIS